MAIKLQRYRTDPTYDGTTLDQDLYSLESAVLGLEALKHDSKLLGDYKVNTVSLGLESAVQRVSDALKALWTKLLALFKRFISWAKTTDFAALVKKIKARIEQIVQSIPELKRRKLDDPRKVIIDDFNNTSGGTVKQVLAVLTKNSYPKDAYQALLKHVRTRYPETFSKQPDFQILGRASWTEEYYFTAVTELKKNPAMKLLEHLFDVHEYLRTTDTFLKTTTVPLKTIVGETTRVVPDLENLYALKGEWLEAIEKSGQIDLSDAGQRAVVAGLLEFSTALTKHLRFYQTRDNPVLPNLSIHLPKLHTELSDAVKHPSDVDYRDFDVLRKTLPATLELFKDVADDSLEGASWDELKHEVGYRLSDKSIKEHVEANETAFTDSLKYLTEEILTTTAFSQATIHYSGNEYLSLDQLRVLDQLEQLLDSHLTTLSGETQSSSAFYEVFKLVQKIIMAVARFQKESATAYENVAKTYERLVKNVYNAPNVSI